MKLVLDECIDRKLTKEFVGYEIKTVPQMGWAGTKNGKLLALVEKEWFFGYFYGKPGSKSLKVLLCRHFIENMEIIVYNPCPVRVLLSSILNYHKRDARAKRI
jgi:hypothetical protein